MCKDYLGRVNCLALLLMGVAMLVGSLTSLGAIAKSL